ncbi:unnamed protein product, partial [Rotaria sp. Silwood2]
MAGFSYTGVGDTVRCEKCQLDVSGWTQGMVPKVVHADRNPSCPFVCSALVNPCMESNDQENPRKCQKIELNSDQCKYNCELWEVNKLKQIRRRTFSHWSHPIKPSAEQMIDAADTDDPSEVHKALSPKCPYVLSILIQPERSSPVILNEISTNNRNNQIFGSTNAAQLQFDQIVNTTTTNKENSAVSETSSTKISSIVNPCIICHQDEKQLACIPC